MDEVQVNVQDGRGIGLLSYNVRIPDLFEEGFGHKILLGRDGSLGHEGKITVFTHIAPYGFRKPEV